MADKGIGEGFCDAHGAFTMDAQDSPCPSCEDGDELATGEGCLDGMRCPSCGNTTDFKIVFTAWGRFYEDGLDEHDDSEFDDESPCVCHGCQFSGAVADFVVGWEPRPDTAWHDDAIQFPRLLAEITGTLALTQDQKQELCDSMDLEWSQIEELLNRAQATWDARKAALKERAERKARGHEEAGHA